jgi:hypothetical protein
LFLVLEIVMRFAVSREAVLRIGHPSFGE